MARLTADQIVERIANVHGVEPVLMRKQVEQTIQKIIVDTSQPYSFMLTDAFSHGKLSMDELVVLLEYELYDALMPKFSGWEWTGEGYRNIRAFGKI